MQKKPSMGMVLAGEYDKELRNPDLILLALATVYLFAGTMEIMVSTV